MHVHRAESVWCSCRCGNGKMAGLLFLVRAARVPEWDDPVAQALFVVSCTVGCDDGARVAAHRALSFLTVQI